MGALVLGGDVLYRSSGISNSGNEVVNMTEERKKELMEETAKNIFEDAFKDLPYLRQRMNMLIDTVAAEAREEGTKEAYAYLIKIHPASLEQIANLMNELLEKKNV